MQRIPLYGAALALAFLFLSGCASVIDAPSAVPQRSASASASPAAADAGIPPGTPTREWWKAFHDPLLDALVAQARERNHDLRAALASVKAARALADAAQREGQPQGRLEANAQVLRPSTAEADPYRQDLPRPPSARVAALGQGLAWEIDLFGRVGTAAAVARREGDAAEADLHAATALLQAEVVRQYTGLRQQQQLLRVLAREAAALAPRTQMMQVRLEAGLADRREALAAEAEELRVTAEKAQAQTVLQTHLSALAVLTGRSPTVRDAWTTALLVPAALPDLPSAQTLVHPTDLLARRPDVARADARLRAAVGEAVLASRAHLPRLSLNLALGLNAPMGSLGEAGALRYAAGPALQWDWLDGGRLKAREAAARAGQEAAWHAFEQAVLKALQDSEDALRQWAAAQVALGAAQHGEALAAKVSAHAHARVEAGMEPPPIALEQAAAHERARSTSLAAQADALLAYGQLQLALGAWQPEETAVGGARP